MDTRIFEIHFAFTLNGRKIDMIVAEVEGEEIAAKYCYRSGDNYYYTLKNGGASND